MESRGRPRPAFLRALGSTDVPSQIELGGLPYQHVETFKHDNWAATAVYARGPWKVVCKINRTQPLLGLPARWLGRRLAAREERILRELADLPNVPDPCGPVTAHGRPLPTAVAHVFVEGRPLSKDDRPGRAFFEELESLLHTMHARGIAYVDLHKRSNVLVGDDGRPWLIDFQISHRRGRLGRIWPFSFVFSVLAQSDDYHLRKHVLHALPAEQTADLDLQRPWWIRLHRFVAVPFRTARRRLLVRLGVRTGDGRAETEHTPEHAVRLETAPAENASRRAA